jgi:hypothetical protein
MARFEGSSFTIEAALLEAVSKAQQDAAAPSVTKYKVEEIRGDFGGFRGFNMVTVVIEMQGE